MGLIRAERTLVTIAGPPGARPADGLATDFAQRVRDGRPRTDIGNIATATLDNAVTAFDSTERVRRKTIIRVRP